MNPNDQMMLAQLLRSRTGGGPPPAVPGMQPEHPPGLAPVVPPAGGGLPLGAQPTPMQGARPPMMPGQVPGGGMPMQRPMMPPGGMQRPMMPMQRPPGMTPLIPQSPPGSASTMSRYRPTQ